MTAAAGGDERAKGRPAARPTKRRLAASLMLVLVLVLTPATERADASAWGEAGLC